MTPVERRFFQEGGQSEQSLPSVPWPHTNPHLQHTAGLVLAHRGDDFPKALDQGEVIVF
jgi:hypothetical protein